jgi:PAS domain S-box-containing protein
MKGKKAIFLPRVADLPLGASAEKEHWKKELRENGSLLVVPILSQGELIGLLCFDGSLSEQQSKEKDITQLQTVADIIGSTLERQRVGKALEKSQERLNLALQTANEGVWDWDLDSDRLYFGPRYYTMLGYDPNEFPPSYKTWLGLLHPEDREGAKKLAKEFLAKGKKFETEFRMRAKDGRYIDILSTGKGVAFDEKGKPVRLVGTHRDITLRKKTQNELQKSKALLAESQRITGLGSWEMDLITKQISWSDQLYRLVGKHPENFTPNSESLFELIHPDDKKPMKQAFKRALNGNSKYHLEHRVIRDDGEIRHFEVQGEIKFDKTGRGLKAIGTVLDITKRKKTEKLLKKALDETEKAHVQVDAIFKSVSDGLIYTDTTNRILLMNHPAETLLDLKFAKVKGKTLDTFIQDENLIQNFGFLNSNGTEHAQTELDLACNGEIRNIQARSSVVREKNGNKAGIITLLCDVTREREVDRLKSEFISTAAHELRTPLTSVKGFSELLISQDFDQPTREEFLSIIHEKAKVLEKIVADMLNLSRVESGRIIHLETSPCELSEILNDWAEAFCRESTKHPLELFLPNSKTRLFIDKEKIVQVLDNLASNAAKFSAPGTLIQLVCEKNDQEFRVSTKDQGIGMTPEQSKRIFDKFYRVDASNTSAPGLGLGMAIAKSIVEAHGGRIWVESVFGQGTTATFTLPMNLAESP